MLAIMLIAPAMVAAVVPIRISRLRTCPSSWAITPSSSSRVRSRRMPSVAATEGILRLLTREELEGVMAHELGHVRNRDILIGTTAATIAGAISMIANMAQWAMIFGGGRREDDEG